MIIKESKLKGLYIIEPSVNEDERGLFYRVYCKNEFKKLGLKKEFVQINQSVNFKKGTFRGLHYQVPPYGDDKLIRCIQGKVLDIVVDVRKNSQTFLQYFMIELSDENRKMLFVPEGFAHGFLTLEDNSQLNYQHTSFYQPGHEGMLNINDPKLKIDLNNQISVISERDKCIPFLDDSFVGIQK